MAVEKNVGGRPRHGPDLKSAPISLRTSSALRARIDEAARQRGLSLTQEVERRLQASFDASPDPATDELMRNVAGAARLVEEATGEKWSESETSYEAFSRAIHLLIRSLAPTELQLQWHTLAEMGEAVRRIDELSNEAEQLERHHPELLEAPDDAPETVRLRYEAVKGEWKQVSGHIRSLRDSIDSPRERSRTYSPLAREVVAKLLGSGPSWSGAFHGRQI